MASRSHSWFDVEKLLRGERMVRSGRVRLRTASPPYWWEGTLILTTDRLFFLSDADNPLLGHSAFWLSDVSRVTQPGRNLLAVDTPGRPQTKFQMLGLASQLPGRQRAWLDAIEAVRPGARPRNTFQDGSPQRAAG